MYGSGIVKGLAVTLKHFFMTFIDDFKRWRKGYRYSTPECVAYRMSTDVEGLFTVQYPEEKLIIPEEFRFTPFLVYEEKENGVKEYRCTSCGICSKVCPPQCIWIVRTTDPSTGRPIPAPAEFFIDVDICMNCCLCAEYCPFDAIKMDHNYEMSVYNRMEKNIFNKERLGKPVSYYAAIRPNNYAREQAARAEAEAAKAARKAQ